MRGYVYHGKIGGLDLDRAFVEATPRLKSNTGCEHTERNAILYSKAVAAAAAQHVISWLWYHYEKGMASGISRRAVDVLRSIS